MLPIKRMFFHECGHADGYFEEVRPVLVDGQGKAVHHAWSAVNGVGKTTMLSLFFNVLLPARDKFLRTLKGENVKLEDYFTPGRVGIVAIEFSRGESGLFGDRSLVVAQVVYRPTQADKNTIRRFVAFEADADHAFDSLPFRGLGAGTAAGVTSLREMQDWIQSWRDRYPSFFTTENQGDWMDFLDDRGIDRALVELQLTFCLDEGNIDKWLSFKHEKDFVSKFFSLVLDPAQAASARKIMLAMAVKLAAVKPMEDRLQQAAVFQKAAEAAVGPARTWLAAEATRAAAVARAEDLYAEVQRAVLTLTQTKSAAETEAELQKSLAETATATAATARSEHRRLRLAIAAREVRDAQALLTRGQEVLAAANLDVRQIEAEAARRRWQELAGLQARCDWALRLAQEEIAPVREAAAAVGDRLRGGLRHAIATRREELERIQTEVAQLDDEACARADRSAEAQKRLDAATAAVVRLGDRLDRLDTQLVRLQEEGCLTIGESIDAALDRWQAAEAEAAAALETAEKAITASEQEREELREAHASLTATTITKRARHEELTAQWAAGEAARAALRELPLLRRLEEEPDPDSPRLRHRLQDRETALSTRRPRLVDTLEDLKARLAFIKQHGTTAVDGDVERVVGALRQGGIEARAYGAWLADTVPDAEQAMALVTSDPARFGGVLVNDERALRDSEAVMAEARPLLHGPVMISLPTHDATAASHGVTVVPPTSAARFNSAAAAQEKDALTKELSKATADLDTLGAEYSELRAAQAQLQEYLGAYGAQRLAGWRTAIDAVDAELAAAVLEDERLEGAISRAEEAMQDARSQRRGIVDSRNAAAANAAALRRFRDDDGWAQRADWQAERQSRTNEAAAMQAEISALAAAEGRAAYTVRRLVGLEGELGEQVKRYNDAFNEVEHHGPGEPEPLRDNLDDLRREYRRAAEALAQSQDAVMATAQADRDHAAKRAAEAKELYDAADAACAESPDEERAAVLAALDNLDLRLRDARRVEDEATEADNDAMVGLRTAENQLRSMRTAVASEAATEGRAPEELTEDDIENPATALVAALAAAQAEAESHAAQADVAAKKRQESLTTARDAKAAISTAKGMASTLALMAELADDETPAAVADSRSIEEIQDELTQLQGETKMAAAALARAKGAADRSISGLKGVSGDDGFRGNFPRVASVLTEADHHTIAESMDALIRQVRNIEHAARDELANLEDDRASTITILGDLLGRGVQLLCQAATLSRIPDEVPLFGGSAALKLGHQLSGRKESQRDLLDRFLRERILEGRIPETGAALAAELVYYVYGAQSEHPLGIRILKTKEHAKDPYIYVGGASYSGGEKITGAMLIYAILQQMRQRTRHRTERTLPAGALMLDNPFGEATRPDLVVLQFAMLSKMNIQLIAATPTVEPHIFAHFGSVSRLVVGRRVRRDGVNYTLVAIASSQHLDGEDAA